MQQANVNKLHCNIESDIKKLQLTS